MASRQLAALLRTIAANVRARRLAKKLTQEELAERVSVETRYLQKIESGEVGVSLEVLLNLAKALGTTPDRLLRPGARLLKAKRGRPPSQKHRL
jgi:transcriptional regulator with XRE-family HTH domain